MLHIIKYIIFVQSGVNMDDFRGFQTDRDGMRRDGDRMNEHEMREEWHRRMDFDRRHEMERRKEHDRRHDFDLRFPFWWLFFR